MAYQQKPGWVIVTFYSVQNVSSLKIMSIIWKDVEVYSYTTNYEEIPLMFS